MFRDFATLAAFGGWFPDVYQLWCLEIRENTLINETYAYFSVTTWSLSPEDFYSEKFNINV